MPRGRAEGWTAGPMAGGAAAEAAPGSGDQADAQCPRAPAPTPSQGPPLPPPALLPALPSAEQDQQEVWPAPGMATGSVATRFRRARSSRETADPPGRRAAL